MRAFKSFLRRLWFCKLRNEHLASGVGIVSKGMCWSGCCVLCRKEVLWLKDGGKFWFHLRTASRPVFTTTLILALLLCLTTGTDASRHRALMMQQVVASGFSPTDIIGLYAWYRDDALLVGDGNPVSTWTDVVNGENQTQAAGKRPTFRSAGGPASTTAVEFDGTDDSMGSATTLDLSTGLKFALSFWMYWDAYANDDDLAMEFSSNAGGTLNGFYIDPNASGGNFDISVASGVGLNLSHITRPPAVEWVHYAVNFDIGIAAGSEVAAVYTNGVAATIVNDVGNNNTANLSADTFYLGGRANTSLFMDGKLHNVMVFTNMNLSAGNVANLFSYK